MRTALAARERRERKTVLAKAVLCDLCALSRPILHRARRSPSPFAERGGQPEGLPAISRGLSAAIPPVIARRAAHPERVPATMPHLLALASFQDAAVRRTCPGVSARGARLNPRLIAGNPPGWPGSEPPQPAIPHKTAESLEIRGNPLAMNRISLPPALQTPYPAAKGALPGRKRCLTFSEKVTNLFGKGALPCRQGCHTLWERAGHPRRPGALGSPSWPGTVATEYGLPAPKSSSTPC